MNKSESIVNLSKAFAQAQAEFPAIKFDSTNPFLKNKFASLGAVIEGTRPVLAKHGLSVIQLSFSEGELFGVETILLHSSGEFISERMSMAADDEKGKSAAQVAGSIITYIRRYSLASILGIYSDEDGDANKPQAQAKPEPKPVSDSDTMTLERALIQTNSEGVKYSDLPTEKLQVMQLGINKALKNNNLNPEDRKVYEAKLAASKVIIKARHDGEIQ